MNSILEILRFVYLEESDIILTPIGRAFADADILSRKSIFSQQLLAHVPLIRHIKFLLEKQPNSIIDKTKILSELPAILAIVFRVKSSSLAKR